MVQLRHLALGRSANSLNVLRIDGILQSTANMVIAGIARSESPCVIAIEAAGEPTSTYKTKPFDAFVMRGSGVRVTQAAPTHFDPDHGVSA